MASPKSRCCCSIRCLSQHVNGSSKSSSNIIEDDDDDEYSSIGVNLTSSISKDNNYNNNYNEKYSWIKGENLDLAADLRTFRPGDKLDIPYELTVTEGLQDFWQSAFHAQDRIHTSRPFCRKMGLQDRVLPFSLALFLASSMTHADTAKVQVGFGKVHYLWPAFPGDTFTKSFTVDSVRNTSDGNHSVRANWLESVFL